MTHFEYNIFGPQIIKDITNLIFKFTYNRALKNINDTIDFRCITAKTLSVPLAWKNYIRYDTDCIIFFIDWNTMLKFKKDCYIRHKEIIRTIKMLHWAALRNNISDSDKTLIAYYYTKSECIRCIKNRSFQVDRIIQGIWNVLLCDNIRIVQQYNLERLKQMYIKIPSKNLFLVQTPISSLPEFKSILDILMFC